MKNVLFTGSWRYIRADIEHDVRADVARVMADGHRIVAGGALGVDQWAMDTAFQMDPTAHRLSIVLPTTFDIYAAHLRRRVVEGVTTSDRVEPLIDLITRVQAVRPSAIINGPADICNTETYYARNTVMNNMADMAYAYHVNDTAGTADQIDKARAKGIPVTVRTYRVLPLPLPVGEG